METAETVVIQLLAKASIFKYRAMATNTQVLIKFCHYLSDTLCSPICYGCGLWSSRWELLRIQNFAMFHEENEWKLPHSGPEKHISKLLHGSCDLHRSGTKTSERMSPSTHLLTILLNTFTKGLRNSREKWQKRKTKAHQKILWHFEIHRWICRKFGKWRILSKTNYAIITFYLCLSNPDVENVF